MFGISSTVIVIVLAALAALVLLAALGMRKPKRAEKWEKAAIMKQLLDLSEQEQGLRRPGPAARPRTTAARPAMRPANAPLKASAQTTLPRHSKAR